MWVCPVFSHFLGQRSAERALPNLANHEQPYSVYGCSPGFGCGGFGRFGADLPYCLKSLGALPRFPAFLAFIYSPLWDEWWAPQQFSDSARP